ncbi:MAG: hypothetical protein K0U10_06980 [Gammaproteobacteria bacterium]|nr:hypothetical protein [Gammaproteobacteria bacterium]
MNILLYLCLINSLLAHPGVPNPNGVPVNLAQRRSSTPYLSGDTFRHMCNHIFDETNITFRPAAVKKGDIIFVRNDVLNLFFSKYHPHVPNPYILVTHSGIFGVPSKYVNYLEDSKIIAWFGHNPDSVHSKFHPIPLGLANYHWPHGKFEKIINAQNHFPNFRNDAKTYVNFRIHTNQAVRIPILNHFKTQSFSIVKSNRSYDLYLQDLGQTTFVVSPPGAGLDCHRNWEALYLKSIPIIKHSQLDPLFEDLPVILVDNFEVITEDYLMNQLQLIKEKNYNFEKLYAPYWFNRIRQVQREYLTQQDNNQ